ncbi:MAG: 5-formyltetrahydrofolate cyclo-ligase [Sediminibacterium sp.]|nr:5-formyltetrahydrofolate cyclo-ligase [Sediminibacterium sp.]
MDKASIRTAYKEKRKALSLKDKIKLDDLLLLQFQRLDFGGVNSIFTYWPMEHQMEPNTHLFSGYLRHMIPGLTIAYPKINDNDTMEAILIDEETVYTTNQWGLTEPEAGPVCSPASIDLVLVPLLVFDQSGYRVGYGKGYYDRFLAQCRQNAILVGLSYFEPIALISDTHEFDIPLNIGITPQLIYEF